MGQRRCGIFLGQHIMLAMAIVALGRVRIAKLINFPMVGFKITLGYFMVALATGIDDALLETLSIRAENFMGIMAHTPALKLKI